MSVDDLGAKLTEALQICDLGDELKSSYYLSNIASLLNSLSMKGDTANATAATNRRKNVRHSELLNLEHHVGNLKER